MNIRRLLGKTQEEIEEDNYEYKKIVDDIKKKLNFISDHYSHYELKSFSMEKGEARILVNYRTTIFLSPAAINEFFYLATEMAENNICIFNEYEDKIKKLIKYGFGSNYKKPFGIEEPFRDYDE